eukprot:g33093.t1
MALSTGGLLLHKAMQQTVGRCDGSRIEGHSNIIWSVVHLEFGDWMSWLAQSSALRGHLDSAIPKQPLFTATWRSKGEACQMHISVREVVSGRFSWAYRQQRWNLDVGELVESKLTAHIEFDWQAGGCWMLAQDMEFIVKESRKVWIPNHPTHGYRPGHVDDNAEGDSLCVIDDAGNKFQVPRSEALAVDPACLTGVEDLLTLGDFNEPALLHNIRVRYEEDSG